MDMIKLVEPALETFVKYGCIMHICMIWDKGQEITYINGSRIKESKI